MPLESTDLVSSPLSRAELRVKKEVDELRFIMRDIRQDFANFRREMHYHFNSMHHTLDKIDTHIDTRLKRQKDIHNYIFKVLDYLGWIVLGVAISAIFFIPHKF